MNRVFRTLLLWLLIAALPVQGWAAVVKSGCGPAHHDSSPVVAMTDQHDASPAQSHHDGLSGHATADASAKASADKGSAHKSSHYSVCAASCFGAVAPPSVLPLSPLVSSSETVIVSLLPLLAGPIPASLERPPRHIFY